VSGAEGLSVLRRTLEEAIANIKEAIELYLETLPVDERDMLLSREILTTAVEVNV
jgi:predicted RNase H-like HicB family nuclease